MSLRKRCSRTPTLRNGSPNPLYCETSPKCDHYWFYDFRLAGRRYRDTTETSDKHQARNIESRERSRILDGRHGIQTLAPITFEKFAELYLQHHATLHKRSVARDREIVRVLDRAFGSVQLADLTSYRILHFMRDRLAGKWRAHNQTGAAKPIRPGTVNRELDTLKSILSKAVEWRTAKGQRYLLESPARGLRRLKVDNQRTRILTDDEQHRLLEAAPRKLRALIVLALITAARIGELLALRWEDASDGFLTFLQTKNGRARRIPLSHAAHVVLAALPRVEGRRYVFTNAQTADRYTVNGTRHVFRRALVRAGISNPKEITQHTLRHTALSRMIADNIDDYTVMAISGHSSTRMLARYTHPTEERKLDALDTFRVGTRWAQSPTAARDELTGLKDLLEKSGGRQEARTPDLRVANASRTRRKIVVA
jgi:integrase